MPFQCNGIGQENLGVKTRWSKEQKTESFSYWNMVFCKKKIDKGQHEKQEYPGSYEKKGMG
jgi:hypothetical protein